MTRQRMFGSDIEFAAWIRSRSDLPSYDGMTGFGLVASDVDLLLHRYMTSVDSQGTREVQSMGLLEVKTRRGDVGQSQRDTMRKVSKMMTGQTTDGDTVLRCYGVGFLFLSGLTPDDSEEMEWGRFQKSGKIKRKPITISVLMDLLKFERHWHNLTKNPFRRHHKTSVITSVELSPLGFVFEKVVKERS